MGMTEQGIGGEELVSLERTLAALEATREAMTDASDEELEPSFRECEALEAEMLRARASTPAGLAVKVRRAQMYLEFPELAGRWLDSLLADLEKAAG